MMDEGWLHLLGSSDGTRRARLQELLRFASEDGMSAEDRTLIVRCLRVVEARMKSNWRSK